MTSFKQFDANGRNARKSTGPVIPRNFEHTVGRK